MERGDYVARTRETVGQFLGHWLKTYAATNTSLRTQQGYRAKIKGYILPRIGNIRLQNLTARDIQEIYSLLLDRGLSPTTVLHVHRILREALSHAVRWGMLARNVADAATPPRRRSREIPTWDAPTVNRFLETAAESPFRDFYHLAVLTGMRRSELAGLKWESVDLTAGTLSVVRTLQRIRRMGLVEGQPKTAKSRRLITLSPDTVQLLHGIRGRQIEERLALGAAFHDTGFVFTRPDGRPIDPDAVTQEFTEVVRATGLPHLTLHGLRHVHATLMLGAGIHPKVVSERLGHSTVGITLDTYSHVLPSLQEQAASAVDGALAGR